MVTTTTTAANSTTLAIDGGRPVRDVKQRPIPPWPYFWEDEKDAVRAVLDSGRVNYWTGPLGQQFQERFAAYVGTRYAIAVNSGTSAIQIALAACGVGPGDEVIVPARTFLATAAAVMHQGAVPVFADVDPRTHTIDPASVEKLINPRTRAIIPVHLAGHPAPMDELMALANRHGLFVVEDAAQAHGGTYKGRKVGALGHIAAWSFCQDKIITTGGEGGMVTTDDAEMAAVCRSVKDHGFEEEERMNLLQKESLNLYTHYRIGYNFRLTEMQSAIGIKATEKLDDHVAKRRANARRLSEGLRDLADAGLLQTSYEAQDVEHAYYCYYLMLNLGGISSDRDQVVRALRAEGIRAGKGTSAENYLEPVFQGHVGFGRTHFPFDYGREGGAMPDYSRVVCPVARDLGDRSIRLEVYPTLTAEDMDDQVAAIRKVVAAYRR